MKRKPIAIIGVSGSLLLLSACLTIGLVGLAVRWYFGPETDSRIIRIMSLAPLTTPRASLSSEPEDNRSAGPVANESGAQPDPGPAPAAPDPGPASEEDEEDLTFSLPPGTVNSITKEGVAKRLVIPKLGLDAPVVLAPIENKTWQVDHLGQAIGHLEGTAPPGSNSNVVFAAHVTLTRGVYGPFAGLGQLTPGDVISVFDGDREFKYVVDGFQTVDRSSVEVAYPTNSGQITLITCSNWNDAEGQYVERLIVTGYLAAG